MTHTPLAMQSEYVDARIYVAGHSGLAGSALVRALRAGGYNNLLTRTHAELDLTNCHAVAAFFQAEKPDVVFLAAAKVGGILANNTFPAEFIQDNLAIQHNVIHGAWLAGVRRLLFLSSSCIYPRESLPCRVRDPDRKGKVEAGVGHAQKTPLKGLRFETIEAAQLYLDRWEARWADTRIRGTTKRQVAVMFAEERPALGPLPPRALSVLPLWRADGPSRWLHRSGGRLLRRAARVDWAPHRRAAERPACPSDGSEDRAIAA